MKRIVTWIIKLVHNAQLRYKFIKYKTTARLEVRTMYPTNETAASHLLDLLALSLTVVGVTN